MQFISRDRDSHSFFPKPRAEASDGAMQHLTETERERKNKVSEECEKGETGKLYQQSLPPAVCCPVTASFVVRFAEDRASLTEMIKAVDFVPEHIRKTGVKTH